MRQILTPVIALGTLADRHLADAPAQLRSALRSCCLVCCAPSVAPACVPCSSIRSWQAWDASNYSSTKVRALSSLLQAVERAVGFDACLLAGGVAALSQQLLQRGTAQVAQRGVEGADGQLVQCAPGIDLGVDE